MTVEDNYKQKAQAAKFLERLSFGAGTNPFSEKDITPLLEVASGAALEGIPKGNDTYRRQWAHIAFHYGADSEAVRRVFQNYKSGDTELEPLVLLRRALRQMSAERYPSPGPDHDDRTNSPDVFETEYLEV